MNVFQIMDEIKTATIDTRNRLKDASIGSRVEQGKGQVVSVTYNEKGVSTVKPLSEWVPISGLSKMITDYQS